MTVTKKTTSTPKSSEGYALGETITYEITVENDGNLTISNISIIDELPGFEFDEGQTVTGITLKPGEKTSVTGSYVVTMDDVIAGEVVNEATAEGETKGDPPEITPGKDPEPTAKLKLVIESATHNWTYNGAAHTDLSYKVTLDGKPVKGTSATEFDLGNGVKLNITPNGATVTHVTDSKNKNNKFTWTITKDGEDAKAAFTVTEKVGTLRILPRTVIMTSGSAAKQFDGLPLVNGALYITGEGFVSGEGASWIVYGAQTQIGWSYNFFTYTLNAGTRASDYNIIPYFGTLFVMGEELIVIEDFETPLGLAGVYNNLGECFE